MPVAEPLVRAVPHPDVDGMEQVPEVQGIELAPVLIVRRKAFPNAAAAGLSVLEYDDPKASDEFRRLADFLFVHTSDIGEQSNGNRKESKT